LSWSAFSAVVIWGISFIATKFALREIHPLTLLTLRFGIGFLLLLLVQLLLERDFLKIFSRRDWGTIFFLGLVGVALHTLLQAYGLLYTTAINTGWIIAIDPVFIVLAARLFLGEPITPRKVLGILLGFMGIAFVISKGKFSLSMFRLASTFGDLLVLSSAVTWTAFTIGGRGFLSRFPPLTVITPVMGAGCLGTLPFSLFEGDWSYLGHLSVTAWGSLLFLGIFCSGLAYLLWYAALRKKDSSTIGMYLYLEPLATLVGALLLLGEEIRVITLVGGSMTLLGVYLATRKA
jgi:drug/metabolite transporter (DMT)-like permease